MLGAQKSQLIRVIIFLGPQCPCVRERRNQEKSIMTGQLPLQNLHYASAIFRDQSRIRAAHNNPVSGVPCVGSQRFPFPWTAVSM